MSIPVVARVTIDGTVQKGQRPAEMYTAESEVSTALIAHANVGLTLEVQRQIREALIAKYAPEGSKSAKRGADTNDAEDV